MRSRTPRHLAVALMLAAVMAAFLGCEDNSRDAAVRNLNSSNSKRLANLYTEFQASHGWRGPKDEAEFKEYIKGLPPTKMELLGFTADTIDDLFVSDRDNQPFRVRYAVRGGFTASDPVIFEQQGVDGKRMVNFTAMGEREIDSDQECDNLWNAKPAPVASRGGDRTLMQAVGREEALSESSQSAAP